ncbi:MAG: nucleotidyltransferase family protein [Nitrospirae bacterium]|nr:nucleotidyltransferase family protein [Nitrospirota bacterium]MBF0542702.1 nucleotidyltransferase family protein [Nitrospirota bacterium]
MKAIEILKGQEELLKIKFRVKRIGIFGSFARDEQREDSDIDVLVDFEEGGKTFDGFMDLKFFLEDLFGRKVDLVTVPALRKEIKEDILKETVYA